MKTERCPWKIRWTFGTDTQCDKDEHGGIQLGLVFIGQDREHSSKLPNGVTTLTWLAGDRREFTGDWPGPCTKLAGCTLHTGHHGRCAL
jgi:hypothetical protein